MGSQKYPSGGGVNMGQNHGYVANGMRRIYARVDGQFRPIGWVRVEDIETGGNTVYIDIMYTQQPEDGEQS